MVNTFHFDSVWEAYGLFLKFQRLCTAFLQTISLQHVGTL